MINLTRRSIAATEQGTKAVERSTAATHKATNALRELLRAEEAQAGRPTKQKPSSGGVTKK